VKLSAPRYVHIVGYGRQVITKDLARYYGERQVLLGALRLDSRRSATRLLAGAARMRGTCDASHCGFDGLGSLTWNSTSTEVSMPDNSMTGTYQLNLPKDLLSEAKRQTKPKDEQLHVEGWRTSWLSRISEFLVGKD
jgi:hypothetical protein